MPFHSLAAVTDLAANPATRFITHAAAQSAAAGLGLTTDRVFAIVARLTSADHYKSMPSLTVHGDIQDVYRVRVYVGEPRRSAMVYCKVGLTADKKGVVVISFKELDLANGGICEISSVRRVRARHGARDH